ncbi:MAG: PEP-CTERM sorting domain-containing protein, partial [Planktothrix sp.]
IQSAQAASFSFTKIADTNNTLFSGFSYYRTGAINNKGNIAFFAFNSNSSTTEDAGIYTGDGKEIATILNNDILAQLYPDPYFAPGAPSNPPPARYSIRGSVDINDQNTVAFSANVSFLGGYDNRQFILMSENGEIKNVGSYGSSARNSSTILIDLDLNNQNSLVTHFITSSVRESTDSIILYKNIGENNQSSKIIAQGNFDNLYRGGIISSRWTSLNNQGNLAFASTYKDLSVPSPYRQISLTDENSITSVMADIDFPQVHLAINDHKEIVFASPISNDQGNGIFSLKNGAITNLVNYDGLFSRFESVDINNHGLVAFGATLDTGTKGIFIGADPFADKVITVGDSLFGSTITNLSFFGDKGLNDQGQIAFYATLADGTSGIFRADPSKKSVPEPTSVLSLLALGVWGLSSRRKSG